MAAEVLRPQELLADSFGRPATSFDRLSPLPASNGILAMKRNHQGKSTPRADKKRSKAVPAGKRPIHGGATTDRHRKGEIAGGGLTTGQVTLLKRGESLSSIASEIPKPSQPQKIVPKNKRLASSAPADVYAGSCISPPSPRALPQPMFVNRKVEPYPSEHGATMFLRRVLGLE